MSDWIAANQRLLSAEFARIRERITGEKSGESLPAIAAARQDMNGAGAIDLLARSFSLTNFERDLLLLCAGAVMDVAIAEQCPPRGYPTFGLALAAFEGAHWSALSPIGPLRRLKLIHVHDDGTLTNSRLGIEERVLHYLAGINYLDPRLQPLLREPTNARPLARSHEEVVAAAIAVLETSGSRSPLQLVGDDTCGQLEIARRLAEHFGLRLRILDASDLPGTPQELVALATLWNRESALLGNALLLRVAEGQSGVAARFAGLPTGLLFIAGSTLVPVEGSSSMRVDKPGTVEQTELWSRALGESARLLNGSIGAVAAQFRLDAGDIVDAARELRAVELSGETLDRELWRACRIRSHKLPDDLARRVEAVATWADLVLPDPELATLRQIAAQARHRLTVHERWGFAARGSRGLGISVLFSGESGTGKTMAAEVLANELKLDLYRIDLASLVSKYIGETEKNLRRVFDAADCSGAILLFDEADALFGKRSEVKDSHDRYANIEVSYLLQRMEAYRGAAILTTNIKGGLDIAFQRRLQFIVRFPFPDVDLRERIWRGVFPPATPLAEVEPSKLAQLNVAGGSIRNIAINAAFLAADAATPVSMAHLLKAARSEALKRERPFSDAEVRGWT